MTPAGLTARCSGRNSASAISTPPNRKGGDNENASRRGEHGGGHITVQAADTREHQPGVSRPEVTDERRTPDHHTPNSHQERQIGDGRRRQRPLETEVSSNR